MPTVLADVSSMIHTRTDALGSASATVTPITDARKALAETDARKERSATPGPASSYTARFRTERASQHRVQTQNEQTQASARLIAKNAAATRTATSRRVAREGASTSAAAALEAFIHAESAGVALSGRNEGQGARQHDVQQSAITLLMCLLRRCATNERWACMIGIHAKLPLTATHEVCN